MGQGKEYRSDVGLTYQMAFLKAMIELIERRAPKDRDGVICLPYRGWMDRMAADLKLAERWIPTEKGKAAADAAKGELEAERG